MLQQFLTDPTSASLARALDGYALRQRAIANNIANVETPGFVRSTVSFESQLRSVMNGSEPARIIDRIGQVVPRTELDSSGQAKPDGNNVNLEQEITDMSKTGLSYKAAAVLLDLKGAMLKTAITEGRR